MISKNRRKKGFTIVELLITFSITAVIVVSLYISISKLKEKQERISEKSAVTEYRDIFLNNIGKDIIIDKIRDIQQTGINSYTIKFKYNYDKTLTINMNSKEIPKNPELCSSATQGFNDSITYNNEIYSLPYIGSDNIRIGGICSKVNTLRIESAEFINETAWVKLNIKIFHPDYGYKYSINLIAPKTP